MDEDLPQANTEVSPDQQFALNVTLDRDGFMRYTCPSCGLDFKVEAPERDLAYLLAPALERIGAELGESISAEGARDVPEIETRILSQCPYCGEGGSSSSMLTEELHDYLQRLFVRDYVLPRLHKVLGGLGDHGTQVSGGLLSFSVSIDYSRGILPPRPIHGPEAPDMTIIELLCCGNRIKVLDNGVREFTCPICQTTVAIQ